MISSNESEYTNFKHPFKVRDKQKDKDSRLNIFSSNESFNWFSSGFKQEIPTFNLIEKNAYSNVSD